MKNTIITLLIFCLSFSFPAITFAVEDPLAVPNNKVGIHILFPAELPDAAKLVNANNGEWGYVIVPIQVGDKDIQKWQHFMNECKRLKIIPIIRIATQGDYFNTKVWEKPSNLDVVDFSNFLNSLHWPTKNRYVIIFNETNRADEWGGSASPQDYAHILSFAVADFKAKSSDFFIIGGGFDNAAPDQGTEYMDQYEYMVQMDKEVPDIFNQIDGYSSHSYPNPGFSQPPEVNTSKSIYSFDHERELLKTLSTKKLPIFITETGWSLEAVNDVKRADYYKTAFNGAWSDPDIVTVAPFLLKASGVFAKFSFLNEDSSQTEQYKAIASLAKAKGQPKMAGAVLSIKSKPTPTLPVKDYRYSQEIKETDFSLSDTFQSTVKWIFKL